MIHRQGPDQCGDSPVNARKEDGPLGGWPPAGRKGHATSGQGGFGLGRTAPAAVGAERESACLAQAIDRVPFGGYVANLNDALWRSVTSGEPNAGQRWQFSSDELVAVDGRTLNATVGPPSRPTCFGRRAL